MPELPEVETIRTILEPQLAGRAIMAVQVRNAQVIAHPDAAGFAALAQGKTISGLSRRGKFLVFDLQGGDRMACHLRMTGCPLVTPANWPLEKHTHLVLNLSDGAQFRYVDTRRFGRLWYLPAGEEDTFTGMAKLGLEPLSPNLTGYYLRECLGRRSKPIKEALLDQTVVAGIGNICADEILWEARIRPDRACSSLSTRAWNKVAAAIPRVIQWGIDTDRMTPEEYLAGAGREYSNIPDLRAYGQQGGPCRWCGTPIKRAVVGGRSAYFCPRCQRKG